MSIKAPWRTEDPSTPLHPSSHHLLFSIPSLPHPSLHLDHTSTRSSLLEVQNPLEWEELYGWTKYCKMTETIMTMNFMSSSHRAGCLAGLTCPIKLLQVQLVKLIIPDSYVIYLKKRPCLILHRCTTTVDISLQVLAIKITNQSVICI